jgi:hypothetical protein
MLLDWRAKRIAEEMTVLTGVEIAAGAMAGERD